jgi:hypothetical protein
MPSTVHEVLQCAAAARSSFYSEGDNGEEQAVVTVLNHICEKDLLGFS